MEQAVPQGEQQAHCKEAAPPHLPAAELSHCAGRDLRRVLRGDPPSGQHRGGHGEHHLRLCQDAGRAVRRPARLAGAVCHHSAGDRPGQKRPADQAHRPAGQGRLGLAEHHHQRHHVGAVGGGEPADGRGVLHLHTGPEGNAGPPAEKAAVPDVPGAEGHAVSGVSGPRQPHVLPVHHRPDHRGRHSGHAGAAGHADPPPALRPGHRRAGGRHRPDPHSRLVDRRHRGRAANPAGVLHEGHLVRGVPHRPAADRGQPDLPPRGGKIRGPAGYLGVLRRHRGQRTGRRRRYAAGRPRLRRDL